MTRGSRKPRPACRAQDQPVGPASAHCASGTRIAGEGEAASSRVPRRQLPRTAAFGTEGGTIGRIDLFIATRERVAVHGIHDGETSILRAAAWDAQLADVDAAAFRLFEEERVRQGRYLVLMQTPDWEFLTGINPGRSATVGEITPRTFPMPPGVERLP